MLERVQSPLAERLAKEPGLIIETVAKEYGATLREAVEALPAEMRRFAPGETFELPMELAGA